MKIKFLDYATYYTVLPNREDSEEEQRFHGLIGTYQKSPNAIVDGRPVWQHGYRSKTVLSYNSGNRLQPRISNFNSYLGAKAWFLFDLENLQLFANSEPFLVNETGWFPVGKTLQGDFRIQNPGYFNESFHVIGNNCLGFIFNMICLLFFQKVKDSIQTILHCL